MPEPRLLRTREAAAYLGLGVSTLERLAARGAVATVRLGGLRHFLPEDLDAFVAAHRVPARDAAPVTIRVTGDDGVARLRARLGRDGAGRPTTTGTKRGARAAV